MKKLIQVLMVASLGIQTLMPTLAYAIDSQEQSSTTSSSTIEEQRSSSGSERIATEEQKQSEAESHSNVSSEMIPPITETDATVDDPATANDKNAPPYEEQVENERKESVQLDYSVQGPGKKYWLEKRFILRIIFELRVLKQL